MERLAEVAREGLRTDIPEFHPGDTIKVMVRVREGDKERLQAFEGLCMGRRGGGINETFRVRKISAGVGVERVYVHQDVYDEFLGLVAEKARALTPGHGPDSSYGPMTMPKQIDVVRSHVTDALARGGRAVVGGPESIGEGVVEPIVLTGVPEDSLAIMEETFGPTLVVNPVRDMAEAVDRANAADFGLAASVFTRSRTTSELIASQLRVGMVSINSWVMYAGVSALPWGGVGQSGFGRIHGPDGLKEFTRAKSTVRERFGIPLQLTSFARHPKTTEVVRRMTSVMHGHGR